MIECTAVSTGEAAAGGWALEGGSALVAEMHAGLITKDGTHEGSPRVTKMLRGVYLHTPESRSG